jgi:hypothetical protein
MRRYQNLILVIENGGAPAPLWRSIVASYEDCQVPYIPPRVSDESINLLFVEPG